MHDMESFQPGDIVFSKDKSLTSSIIQWRTMSQWSHVGVIVGKKKDSGWKTISARGKGVVYERLLDWTGYIQILRVNDITEQQRENFVNFCIEQVGKQYDIWGFLDFFCMKKIQREDRWFCSELIYRGLLNSGIDIFKNKKTPNFVTPGDLYENPSLKMIGEL
jgi:uncharacterized protein YycO